MQAGHVLHERGVVGGVGVTGVWVEVDTLWRRLRDVFCLCVCRDVTVLLLLCGCTCVVSVNLVLSLLLLLLFG